MSLSIRVKVKKRGGKVSNIPLVIHVANKLGPLRKKLVFVGGSIVELLLDKDYPLPPRVTKDVDTTYV